MKKVFAQAYIWLVLFLMYLPILILIAFSFAATVAVQYFFYILQGRWTTHMPTLTETAACSPNSMIFGDAETPFFVNASK